MRAVFKNDSEVEVREYDLGDGKYKVELWVTDNRKAKALDQLIIKEFPMGNITVTVEVVNKSIEHPRADMLRDAFNNNPIVKEIIHAKFSPADKEGSDFVMCSPTAIQFYADNIRDPYGNINMVPEDVMKELFNMEDVYFATDNLTTK